MPGLMRMLYFYGLAPMALFAIGSWKIALAWGIVWSAIWLPITIMYTVEKISAKRRGDRYWW